MTTINQRFIVLKANYESDGFNIYKVHPLGLVLMCEHPKYHIFSVISENPLLIGEEYDARITCRMRSGVTEYYIDHIKFDFPTDAPAQWNLLERFCANDGAKRIFKRLKELFTPYDNILDLLTKNSARTNIKLEELLDEQQLSKLRKLVNRLQNMQAVSQFLNKMPDELAGELTDSQAEKLAKISANNPTKSATDFLNNPWLAMQCEGLGFKRVDVIREKLRQKDPDNMAYAIDNPLRVAYGAYDVLENHVFRNGDTYIDRYKFKNLMVNELKISTDTVSDFMKYGHEFSSIQVFENFRLKFDGGIVTSEQLWNAEQQIYQCLTNSTPPALIKDWDSQLQLFKERENLDLTDEQMAIFQSINENQFSLLTGPGGTGKTYTVSKLIQFAKRVGLKVLLNAPTGKAAQVLRSYTGVHSSTIHSAFKMQPWSVSNEACEVPVSKPDLIVIDEFSMVDSILLGEVLRAYVAHNVKLPRILLIGDENQLPSVGAGNLLHDFITMKLMKLTRLTKVFRIKSQDGGIVKLTEALRKGRFPFKNNDGEIFPVGKDFWGWHTSDPIEVFNRTLQAYRTMLKHGVSIYDIAVLTPKNGGLTGQRELNIALQNVYRKSANLSEDDAYQEIKQYGVKTRFYVGDPIMALKNMKLFLSEDEFASEFDFSEDSDTLSVSNGDIGKVTFVGQDFILASFNEVSCYIHKEDLKLYQLGYAYTIHKSQGSEVKYGILAITSSDAFQLNSNLLYTGASRFKEKLYFIADFNTVRKKAGVFINQDRQTLLHYFEELDLELNF